MGAQGALAKLSPLSSSGLSFVLIGFMWGLSQGTPGAHLSLNCFHAARWCFPGRVVGDPPEEAPSSLSRTHSEGLGASPPVQTRATISRAQSWPSSPLVHAGSSWLQALLPPPFGICVFQGSAAGFWRYFFLGGEPTSLSQSLLTFQAWLRKLLVGM